MNTPQETTGAFIRDASPFAQPGGAGHPTPRLLICLLYTSDAADERSSVDLGGRRIIKKKKTSENVSRSQRTNKHR